MGKVQRILGRLCGFVKRFKLNQSAVSAIEFSLIAAAIAVVIILGVRNIGTNTGKIFSTINTAI